MISLKNLLAGNFVGINFGQFVGAHAGHSNIFYPDFVWIFVLG